MRDDNPLLYRLQQARARRPAWKRALGWLVYPALVLSPWLLSLLPGNECRGRQLFFALAVFLHFAYFCGRPLFEAVTSLASEKQRGTFESLATTGFTARRWIATLFYVCVRPRLIELAVWGWIPIALAPEDPHSGLLSLLCYTAACILLYTAVGLWISGRSRTLTGAQLQSILFLTFTFFVVVALDAVLCSGVSQARGPLFSQYVAPYMGLLMSREPEIRCSCWLASLAYLPVCLWLLYRCERRVGSALATRPAASSPRWMWRTLSRGMGHPLGYRALLQMSRDRLLLLRLLGYPAIFYALRCLPHVSEEQWEVRRVTESCFYLTLFGHMLYLTVRAALAGSVSVAEERESRTWESLLSTRLSLNSLLWGQWAVCSLPILLECVLWSFLWLTYMGDADPSLHNHKYAWGLSLANVVVLVAYSLAWTSFVGALAMWLSGRCASAAQALRGTTVVVFLLVFGTLAVGVLCHVEWIASISPALCLGELSGHCLRACLSLLGYASASVVLLGLCRRNLARQRLSGC